MWLCMKTYFGSICNVLRINSKVAGVDVKSKQNTFSVWVLDSNWALTFPCTYIKYIMFVCRYFSYAKFPLLDGEPILSVILLLSTLLSLQLRARYYMSTYLNSTKISALSPLGHIARCFEDCWKPTLLLNYNILILKDLYLFVFLLWELLIHQIKAHSEDFNTSLCIEK